MRRILLLATLLFLLAPASALAAPHLAITTDGAGTLTVTGSVEADDTSIAGTPGAVRIYQNDSPGLGGTGTVSYPGGCWADVFLVVTCDGLTIDTVVVDLGDGDDRASIGNLTGVVIHAAGGTGNDQLWGDDRGDILIGGDGNDTLRAGTGDDTVDGGIGDDSVEGGLGSDSIDGGPGTDTLRNDTRSTGAVIDLRTGTGGGPGGEVDTFAAVETVYGSPHGDTITAPDVATVVWALGGADTIHGGAAADDLTGATENDTIFGNGGADTIRGEWGDDVIDGGAGLDVMDGGIGSDTISFATAADPVTIDLVAATATLAGDTETLVGFEHATGGSGADTLVSGAGAQTLIGGPGDDALNGGEGDDALRGGAGADSVSGGEGDDVLRGGPGADDVDGEGGTGDVADYADAAGGVSASLAAGSSSEGDTLAGVEVLTGSPHGDTLTAGPGSRAYGAGGADTLRSSGGAVTLDGGDGDDAFAAAPSGAVTLTGGGGSDTLDLTDSGEPITAMPGTGVLDVSAAATYSVTQVEHLVGSPHDDDIAVAAPLQSAAGGSGNDTLTGSTSGQTLSGGPGDDEFPYTAGPHAIGGGPGVDTATYDTAPSAVGVSLGAGADDGTAGEGDDVGADVEVIHGSPYADTLTAGTAPATLHGAGGDDALTGGADDDALNGDAGDDSLAGGAGDDALNGDAGVDSLAGGAGEDGLDGGADDDTLDGGSGADALDGGLGVDVADYGDRMDAVEVDLAAGSEGAGDSLLGIEDVIGGSAADVLRGDSAVNRLDGGPGADELVAAGGGDTLAGGDGADLLLALDAGANTLDGGDGHDRVNAANKAVGDQIACGTGDDQAERDPGDTTGPDCERGAARAAAWAGELVLTQPLPALTNATGDVVVQFANDQPGPLDHECRIDEGAWTPCISPHAFADPGEGEHALELRSTDFHGDVTTLATTVRIDRTAPVAGFGAVTRRTFADRVAVPLLSDETGRFECRTGSGPWTACATPWTVGLALGENAFAVRAVDAAGNVGPAAALTVTRLAPAIPDAPEGDASTTPPGRPGDLAPDRCSPERVQLRRLGVTRRGVGVITGSLRADLGRPLELRRRGSDRVLATLHPREGGRFRARFAVRRGTRVAVFSGGRRVTSYLAVRRRLSNVSAVRRSDGRVSVRGAVAAAGSPRVTVSVRGCDDRWRTAAHARVRRGRIALLLRAGSDAQQLRIVVRRAHRAWYSVPFGIAP